MAHVLITRVQREAEATSALLATAGHTSLIAPLMRITAHQAGLERAAALAQEAMMPMLCVATSAHALDALIEAGLAGFVAAQRWAVVGGRCAHLLGTLGGSHLVLEAPDVEALVALLGAEQPVAYFCGVHRRSQLEEAYPEMESVAVYEAQALPAFSQSQLESIKKRPPSDGLVFSARSAQLLARALDAAEGAPLLGSTRWLCLSQDVADALRAGMAATPHTLVSERPTQEALIKLLG